MFAPDYYRIRCLLKLVAFLQEGEVEKLYKQFLGDFGAQPATSAKIYNLYHFDSVLKTLDATRRISLALDKKACLDDSVALNVRRGGIAVRARSSDSAAGNAGISGRVAVRRVPAWPPRGRAP